MNSMENFFNWMSKPIPDDEVTIWFNIHNMNFEKIELYGDIFKSLNHVVVDTYMGDSGEYSETKISLSQEDKELHFELNLKLSISIGHCNFIRIGLKLSISTIIF